MSKIRLTEDNLRRVVREVLSEGYSAKYFESQIWWIVEDFWQFKDTPTTERYLSKSYPIVISMRPFFRDGEVDERYLGDTEYHVKLYINTEDESNHIDGGFTPDFISNNQLNQISICIGQSTEKKSLFSVLKHEVTHLVDYVIKMCKNQTMHQYPVKRMRRLGIPKYAMLILYTLWNTSEFNAWHTTYNTDTPTDDVHFENIMKALNMLNSNNNEEDWTLIRDYVAQTTGNPMIARKTTTGFKNYFINTSFKLIKKMVKKYY